ncbi:prolyl oligopeptidase family serine peptidase [Paenibacillus barcinonensis]|uniref:prolyl oligopeptidase family serine peptidase n=1 Tax=Paenibacillus barcinonensis TaxID=198119 RepID=UPI001C119C13|nr:prolyl oligopeptidase family serine peptidase [Paenibacillus barcinonensis]MBU5350688.1 prolyl oligopeptidase family serine peptidase [Paenibacillus barcinonensis]
MNMKKSLLSGFLALALTSSLLVSTNVSANNSTESSSSLSYSFVTKGYDWGPAVYKIILDTGNTIQGNSLTKDTFKVLAERSYPMINFQTQQTYDGSDSSSRTIEKAYLSDKNGKPISMSSSQYITIEMKVHPDLMTASPFMFDLQSFTNRYVDLQYTIIQQKSLQDQAGNVIDYLTTRPDTPHTMIEQGVEPFDLTGKFKYKDSKYGEIHLTYASYMPETSKKKPLIIWLHGAGEGGTDPRIALLGNKVTALADESIQKYFGDAAVLVPQTPTFWMNDGTGQYTKDGKSMYTRSLTALIKQYVKQHAADIDTDRIYIGGCSNGGFMTLNMLLANPDYFAAAYPSAEAYDDSWLTKQDIAKLKNIPIWFTAAGADQTVDTSKTSTATYKRLIAAGAKNVHYSYFDKVLDMSGLYSKGNGDNAPYEYNGHWSWIPVLNNDISKDFNGKPVKMKGKAVTLMEWMANQKK